VLASLNRRLHQTIEVYHEDTIGTNRVVALRRCSGRDLGARSHELSLLPSDHPVTLLSPQGSKPQALTGLAQQCVRMVDVIAAQTRLGDPHAISYARASRITALQMALAGDRDAADCGLASEARSRAIRSALCRE
jgi:hypothetical protein